MDKPYRPKLLKIMLGLGAAYYLIGAVTHYFGLSLFPFYEAKLFSPYHDYLLAIAGMTFGLILLTIAKDPIKNRDTLKTAIFCIPIASLASIAVIWKIDFAALGAPAKKTETILEGISGLIYSTILSWLYTKNKL